MSTRLQAPTTEEHGPVAIDPHSPVPPPDHRPRGKLAPYLAVGLAKTAAAYACYAGLVLLHTPHQAALILTFLLATALGYWGHSRLVFKAGGHSAATLYYVTAAVLYFVNAGLLEGLVRIGTGPLIAQLLCQLATIPLGYLLVAATMHWWSRRIS